MNTVPQINSSFSTKTQFLQLAWDSTSLRTLQECPRKYFLSIVLGHVPRITNVHLTFGQYYHSCLEFFDHQRAQGVEAHKAQIATLKFAMGLTWDRERKRPWSSGDPNKNRYTLIRTVMWYLFHYEEDSAETVILADGKPAVELSFRFPIDHHSFDEEQFMLCGHLDRLAALGGDTWVFDKKTSKHEIKEDYFAGYSPDAQMDLYTLTGKVVYQTPVKGVIIDAAQIGATFSRFRRGPTLRTDDQLAEFYADSIYWIGQAEGFARKGYWPMNRMSCGNYGGCPFRGLCAKPPSVRNQWLNADFPKRIWDPLQIRGDI
jgi:hypothetical protein